MTINLKNVQAIGNWGDGVVLELEDGVNVNVDGLYAVGNMGCGVRISRRAGLLEYYGLPKDTDPKEFAKLLLAISNVPRHDKEQVIRKSPLFSKFTIGALTTVTLVSNLINIANQPETQTLIADLLS